MTGNEISESDNQTLQALKKKHEYLKSHLIVAKKLSNQTIKLRFYAKKSFFVLVHLILLASSLALIGYLNAVILGYTYGLPRQCGVPLVVSAVLIAEMYDKDPIEGDDQKVLRMLRKLTAFIGVAMLGFMVIGEGYLFDFKYKNDYKNLQ